MDQIKDQIISNNWQMIIKNTLVNVLKFDYFNK